MIFEASMLFSAAYAEKGMCRRTPFGLKAIDDGSQFSSVNHQVPTDIDEKPLQIYEVQQKRVGPKMWGLAQNVVPNDDGDISCPIDYVDTSHIQLVEA